MTASPNPPVALYALIGCMFIIVVSVIQEYNVNLAVLIFSIGVIGVPYIHLIIRKEDK